MSVRPVWIGALFAGVLSSPSQAAPPSAGTILQQTRPAPTLPQAPGPALELPAPPAQHAASKLAFKVRHVVVRGNTLVPDADLKPLVAPLDGQTVTLERLQQAADRITALYQSRGYPLAYAYLPAQKIRDGEVTIAIVEPRYDRIDVEGQARMPAGRAEKTLGLKAGEPIEAGPLERGLLLLNQTPGLRVAGTLVPGAQAGTSTLQAHVSDTPLLRLSAGVDDYGGNETGRIRGQAQASLDDPLGYGEQVGANILSTQGGLLRAGGLNLLSPDLIGGLRIGAYGSYTGYHLGQAFAALGEKGLAVQWGLSASLPLILAPGRLLEVRADVLRNRFAQSSRISNIDDRSHLTLGRLTVDGSLADAWRGVSAGGLTVSGGNKGIDSNATRALDAAGPRTAGTFWVAQMQAQRLQRLPGQFQLQAAVSGQVSSRNLDGSQKFYLGGPQGVMSYAVGEAGGDAGVLTRLSLAHSIPLPLPGSLMAAGLLQGGRAWLNHHVYSGAPGPNRLDLGGAGAELSYQWGTHLSLQLDYVHRLGNTPDTSGSNPHGEFWASLQAAL